MLLIYPEKVEILHSFVFLSYLFYYRKVNCETSQLYINRPALNVPAFPYQSKEKKIWIRCYDIQGVPFEKIKFCASEISESRH